MFLKFNQAVCINGNDYKKGIHEVPEKDLAHPFLQKFVKLGLVVESPRHIPITPKDIQEKNELLAKKLAEVASKQPKEALDAQTPPQAPASETPPPSEPPGSPTFGDKGEDEGDEEDHDDEEEKEAPKKKGVTPSSKKNFKNNKR